MSAMPAGWTELSEPTPVRAASVAGQRRTDRRAELKEARRARRRWAVTAGSLLFVFFALTVVILELLR